MQPTAHELLAFVRTVQRGSGIPGIAVARARDGITVHVSVGTRAAGRDAPLDVSHRFHAGCVTKLLLALVTLELAREGCLALDAPLAEYLPELGGSVVGNQVQVAHLLSHTSGYRGTSIFDPATRALDWRSFVAYLRQTPQLFAPGTVFSYEHTEAVLLGDLLERAAGTPCLALVRERVLDPLGIVPGMVGDLTSAGQHDYDPTLRRFAPLEHVEPPSLFWLPAFSAFTLSVMHLATIARSVLAAAWDASAVLSRPSFALLVSEAVRLPAAFGGPLSELLPVAFGLGAAHLRGGSFGATGLTRGQCLGLRFDPGAGIAASVGLNAVVPPLRDGLLDALCDEPGPAPAASRAAAPHAFEPAEWTGVYIGPGHGVVKVAAIGDGLRCEIGREHAGPSVAVELVRDAVRGFVLTSPLPQLSLAFFRSGEDAALMLGLSAFKRVRDGRGNGAAQQKLAVP